MSAQNRQIGQLTRPKDQVKDILSNLTVLLGILATAKLANHLLNPGALHVNILQISVCETDQIRITLNSKGGCETV